MRVAQKRIASAGSGVHDVSAPNAGSLGALVVDARDVPAAIDALIGVATAARAHGWGAIRSTWPSWGSYGRRSRWAR